MFEPSYGDSDLRHQASWALLRDSQDDPFSPSYRPLASDKEMQSFKPEVRERCMKSFDDLRYELGRHPATGIVRVATWDSLKALLVPPALRDGDDHDKALWRFLDEVATWMTDEECDSEYGDDGRCPAAVVETTALLLETMAGLRRRSNEPTSAAAKTPLALTTTASAIITGT